MSKYVDTLGGKKDRDMTHAFHVLTLRKDIFARARREVASSDRRYPVTPGVSAELSVKLRSQRSYDGRQSHHIDQATCYELCNQRCLNGVLRSVDVSRRAV